MQLVDWEQYLKPAAVSVAAHKARSAATFAPQREAIDSLCRVLRPQTVVCLGAGHLNDIPLERLIADNADIVLVEWIPGISEQSFRRDLVRQVEQHFACLVCRCAGDPKNYCLNHADDGAGAARAGDHCANFEAAAADGVPLCEHYAPGIFPRFVHADVTGGVATHFMREAASVLRQAKKPRQAFREAIQISAHPRAQAALPLADGSADLVTSSMVASQFDFEPYTYFIRNLYARFGRDAVERNAEMAGELAETLRNNLFLTQVEAHCREMQRLLKPGGRIYLSIETLHRDEGAAHWFYAEATAKALEVVARHFLFDLETAPEAVRAVRTNMVGGGASVVQGYVLVKGEPDGAAARGDSRGLRH